jgi:glycosyltransferase involved in cell wall biosynthesis
MTSGPLISVVIPTYKRSHLIKSAFESVAQQSYENWELIIVDDNGKGNQASDDTAKAVRAFYPADNIIYHQLEENMGACAARNKGIELSNGEYVAFLDDDDEWFRNKLEKQVEQIQRDNADVCYSDMYLSNTGRQQYYAHDIQGNHYEALLTRGYGICTSAFLIKKQALMDINGFDHTLSSMQDYDLLIRLCEKGKVTVIKEALFNYKMADDGISANLDAKINGHTGIINKYRDTYARLGLNEGLSRQLECLGDFTLRKGRRREALEHYREAAKVAGPHKRLWVKQVFGALFGGWPLETFLRLRHRATTKPIETQK